MNESGTKRDTAVSTLGQLVESTGYAIKPYREYPKLLGMLLRMLNGDINWEARRQVLRVLGVIGALEPYIHKQNLRVLSLQTSGPGTLSERMDKVWSDYDTEHEDAAAERPPNGGSPEDY